MKIFRNLAIIFGCLAVAVFAAPQYTNPSNPNYGTNKIGQCYAGSLNNWVGIANTSANLTNYAIQCDAQGNLVAPTGGTVTSVSVTTANGVSGTVATATSTPAITLTLGAITPTSTNGVAAASMVSATAPTVGQAACIKSAGPPIVIGTCSTVVGSGGACTCN